MEGGVSRKILVADLLCGAGGSSTGCQRALAALGLKMELVCVNHWGVAIETHQRNHPEARHYCQDISTVRPHLVVPEGYLDLLMASPTCTHHSVVACVIPIRFPAHPTRPSSTLPNYWRVQRRETTPRRKRRKMKRARAKRRMQIHDRH